jgi:hypothetical protein
VRAARGTVQKNPDLKVGVETLASGLVRLAARIGDQNYPWRKARTHRAVVEVLKDDDSALSAYHRLITWAFFDGVQLTKNSWESLRDDIWMVMSGLCPASTRIDKSDPFLAWCDEPPVICGESGSNGTDVRPNVYRVGSGARHVDIQLGSIHSVKGQTHLATLLLSTYFRAHSSERMMAWLLGKKANGGGAGEEDQKRLLQTYVAMTRPTHLVCLAIPEFALGTGNRLKQGIAALKGRGWQVARITNGVANWVADSDVRPDILDEKSQYLLGLQ